MKKYFTSFIALVFSCTAFSQIAVKPQEFENVKNGKTYFIVLDKDLPTVKPYYEVLKKYWTLTPVEMINEKDLAQYVIPGNSFFRFHQIVTREGNLNNVLPDNGMLVPFGQNTQLFNSSNQLYGMNSMNNAYHANGGYGGYGTIGGVSSGPGPMKSAVDIFLDFFSFDDKFIEKNKDKPRAYYSTRDFNVIARIAISLPSDQAIVTDKDFFMFDNLSSSWQPGYFKNYLQYIQKSIADNAPRKIYAQLFDPKLAVLKSDTLFVASNMENNMSDHDVKKEKNLYQDYTHLYKPVNTKDLSDKILNSDTPFYYLLYVHFMPDKFIAVVNSATGEIIYANLSKSKYIRQDDLKDLNAEVSK